MQYRKDRIGNELSILGYGCMRFTQKNGKIDIDKTEKEIMEGISRGINYFTPHAFSLKIAPPLRQEPCSVQLPSVSCTAQTLAGCT